MEPVAGSNPAGASLVRSLPPAPRRLSARRRPPPVGPTLRPRPSAAPRTLAAADRRRGRLRPRPARCTIARRALTTPAPVLEALVLPALESAHGEQLTAHDLHDGLRLEGDDLSG